MFMLDILYDTKKLVSRKDSEEKVILKSAATTLHEAIKKAVSLSLDIDFNEISGGWRTRYEENGEAHIEMFFYDNLASGAGYSSLIGQDGVLEDVLYRARDILTSCNCSKSCRNCLDNFYNQKNHSVFDRMLGLQLLEDGTPIQFEVIPALRRRIRDENGKLYLNPYNLSEWLPNTFLEYLNKIQE